MQHVQPSFASGKERCVLLVSPEDAQREGLETGDTAWLESRVHGGAVPVRVSNEMRPGVVSLPHGWGHTAVAPYQRTAGSRPGVSVNDWADDGDVESVVGQSILNGIAVRLRRLEREAELSPST
jgi:anaerobic selenocysteine-containing dehydrogenase